MPIKNVPLALKEDSTGQLLFVDYELTKTMYVLNDPGDIATFTIDCNLSMEDLDDLHAGWKVYTSMPVGAWDAYKDVLEKSL